MEDAVCATAVPVVTKDDATLSPRTTPPRTKPATASPRTRTQSPMRDAPYPYSQPPLAGQIGGICVPREWFYALFTPAQTLTLRPIGFSDQGVARWPRSGTGEVQD